MELVRSLGLRDARDGGFVSKSKLATARWSTIVLDSKQPAKGVTRMNDWICRIGIVLALLASARCSAQDSLMPVHQYIFLKQASINKYGERAFTVEQQLVPALIEATQKDRVRIHGVWVEESDVMTVGETIKLYSTLLESEPSNTTSLLRRGIAFQLSERYADAIQDYSSVIAIDGKNAKAYECRGAARFARASKSASASPITDIDAAISDLTESIRLSPADNYALVERGNVHRYLKDFDAAIRDYTESIRMNPLEPWGYALRAKASEEKGEKESALKDYTKAITIDDSSTLFLVSRGNVLISMEKFEDAIKDYDKAIRLDANCTMAFFHRAAANQLAEKYEAAIADYTFVIRQSPPAVNALRNRSVVFTTCGQLDDALDDLNSIIAIDPRNAEVFYSRGKILGQQKRYAAAIEDFTESLRLDDTLVQNYRTRGLVYQKLGQFENVVRDFSEFIRRKPTNTGILNELAWIHATCPDEKIRDGVKAVELAKRACEGSNWKNSAFIDTLAAAYAEAGDWQNAVSNQELSIKLAATEPEKVGSRKRLSLYQEKMPYRMTRRENQ